jgi:hypothetical protein
MNPFSAWHREMSSKAPAKKQTATAPPPSASNPSVYWGSLILAFALFLLFAIPHARALQVPWLAPFSFPLKYIAFPLLAFGLSTIASITSQQIACGSVNASGIFNGAPYFIASLYAGLILGAIPYLRAPIVSLMATSERFSGIFAYEREVPFMKGIAQGYWIFFGALVGQIMAGSMAVVC